jgi:predicted TIM-barrel fold metal-dependent hydrolase
MNATQVKSSPAAEIRARLSHPVVDGDAHVIECEFAICDFLRQVAGPDMARRYEESKKRRISSVRHKQTWWNSPSGPHTIDRATVMLPRLYRERLDEAGIDFAVVYTTEGLGAMHVADAEMRQALHRALNTMYADMFSGVRDRLTPSAVIPMHTPEEAVAELEFVANTLKLKTVTVNTEIRRDGALASPAIDQGQAYDPVWRKLVDLKLSVACHNRSQGVGTSRGSPSNYIFNHLGGFAQGSDFFCRALIFGGAAQRFPTLRFGFLEGGVGWGAQLYNSLFEYWEKRNAKQLEANLDPEKVDLDLLVKMFERYGNDYLTPERIRANPHHPSSAIPGPDNRFADEWAESGIKRPGDIRDMFANRFFFGCEADDRMNAVAFDAKLNHYKIRLNAMLGSDIGHWDVIDITDVLPEAWSLVDDELLSEDDFRDFAFGNAVAFHAGLNPDFFTGTVVEDAAAKHLADKSKKGRGR